MADVFDTTDAGLYGTTVLGGSLYTVDGGTTPLHWGSGEACPVANTEGGIQYSYNRPVGNYPFGPVQGYFEGAFSSLLYDSPVAVNPHSTLRGKLALNTEDRGSPTYYAPWFESDNTGTLGASWSYANPSPPPNFLAAPAPWGDALAAPYRMFARKGHILRYINQAQIP